MTIVARRRSYECLAGSSDTFYTRLAGKSFPSGDAFDLCSLVRVEGDAVHYLTVPWAGGRCPDEAELPRRAAPGEYVPLPSGAYIVAANPVRVPSSL